MKIFNLTLLILTVLLWWTLWLLEMPFPNAWPLIALAVLFTADAGSYVFHVILDHHIPAERSVMAAEFQAHHADGMGIARAPLLDVLTPVLPLTLPIGLFMTAPAAVGWIPPALALFLCLLTSAATLAQMAHRWAHHPNPGRLIRAAQRVRLLVTREAHDRHHRTPEGNSPRTDYAILTGWSNPLLDALDAPRRIGQVAAWLGFPRVA